MLLKEASVIVKEILPIKTIGNELGAVRRICLLMFGCKSDWHLISPYLITPESNIKVRSIKELITYKKKLLIVKQILLVSTLGNV